MGILLVLALELGAAFVYQVYRLGYNRGNYDGYVEGLKDSEELVKKCYILEVTAENSEK
jgi:5-formyltetrahydrofolate cyclo-ligase